MDNVNLIDILKLIELSKNNYEKAYIIRRDNDIVFINNGKAQIIKEL